MEKKVPDAELNLPMGCKLNLNIIHCATIGESTFNDLIQTEYSKTVTFGT